MDNLRLLVVFTLFAMVLVNALLALILLFAPHPESRTDRRAMHYFIAFFVFSAVAHVVFGLRYLSPQWMTLSVVVNNPLILAAFYSLHLGVCHRSRTRSILMNPVVALSAFAVFMIVLLALYFADPGVIHSRSYWILTYVEVLLVFSLWAMRGKQAESNLGDRLTRLSLYAAIGLMLGVAISRTFLGIGDIRYMLALSICVMATNILLLGGMYGSFLHDAVARHYRNSVTDSMTGLYNRRYLIDEARQLVSLGARHHFPISVVMCDIDKFKNINDTYGHDIGDEIIKSFARVLRSCVRTEDILARWGGEEFVALLANTKVEEARVLVERMREQTNRINFDTDKGSLTFTASFGVALVDEGLDVEAGVKHADDALYRAKEGGRNRVEIYTD